MKRGGSPARAYSAQIDGHSDRKAIQHIELGREFLSLAWLHAREKHAKGSRLFDAFVLAAKLYKFRRATVERAFRVAAARLA
jgi:hypothetical protein